jgi:hypothetical protein
VIVIVPLVFCVPLQAPEAVQLVAIGEDDQVNVVELPTAIELLPSDIVGAPGTILASAAGAWMNP